MLFFFVDVLSSFLLFFLSSFSLFLALSHHPPFFSLPTLQFCNSKLWCCENVLFLLQVREYKDQYQDSPASKERARKIVEQYLDRDAPLEINLVDTTRKKVLNSMETHIDIDVFNAAEREITNVVKSDSLKKWYLAPDFKNVLTQIVSSRNSSNLASMEMREGKQHTERPRSYVAADE